MTTPAATSFTHAPLATLPSALVYQIMKLRCDVFIVEQELTCDELDGRDLEASTLLIYAHDAAKNADPAAGTATTATTPVVATTRILCNDDEVAIGRVAVARSHRGTGLGRELMQYAVRTCQELYPELPIYVGAQAHLERWYEQFGLQRSGENYLDAGIPHVPMRLYPEATSARHQ